MQMSGDDGQILCAYMFGTCDLPPVPKLNQTALFKGTTKPPPKPLKPCKKEPLKVLHFSDYHLDQRYVVGSEANCGGSLCCRVCKSSSRLFCVDVSNLERHEFSTKMLYFKNTRVGRAFYILNVSNSVHFDHVSSIHGGPHVSATCELF